MDMHVDQAGQHRLVEQVDDGCAFGGRPDAGDNIGDAAINNRDGRRAEHVRFRRRDQPAGVDHLCVGKGWAGKQQRGGDESGADWAHDWNFPGG